jgi:Disulfide bond formation protein DsbB
MAAFNPTSISLLVASLLLLSSYGLQYLVGLEPCYLCLRERYLHLLLVGLGLFFLRLQFLPGLGLITLGVAWSVSATLAGAHAGFEYGFWYLDLPCGGTGPALSLEALQADLEGRSPPPCDEPAITFLGVSLAGANFLISAAMAFYLFRSRLTKGLMPPKL